MQSNDCETSENRCDNRLRRPCDHQVSPGSAESVRPSGLSKRLSEIPVAPPGNQNLPRVPLETVGKSNTFQPLPHFLVFDNRFDNRSDHVR